MATVDELIKEQTASQNAGGGTATATMTEGEKRINNMFDAQKQSQLDQLKASYDQSLAEHQAARDKISPQYQTAANDLSVQHERNKRNLNMQAAANGINTGTASQMALAQNNEHLRDFGNLRASESEALAAADRGIANLTTNYQNNISSAVADNDYKKAAALLDEYNAQYNRDKAKADTLASFGIFSGYKGIYTPEEIAIMENNFAAKNPDLAFAMGTITEGQRENLVNGRPINEGLDATGNRVGGVVSTNVGGGGMSASDALREQLNYLKNTGQITDATWEAQMNQANRF